MLLQVRVGIINFLQLFGKVRRFSQKNLNYVYGQFSFEFV